MTMFIPIFFLIVNTGQAAEIFPSDSTGFLEGQGYGAFQLPITLLLAASFGMAALFLVEEIEGGYFDKLRAIPVPRYSIVLGRLVAEAVKCVVISSVIVLIALPFGIDDRERAARLPAPGLAERALGRRLRRVHAADRPQDPQRRGDQLGRADLLPAAVPDPELRPPRMLTEPMEVAATINPVTYLMEALRSLILVDLDWAEIWPGFAVVAVLGAVMLVLNVRMIRNYD